MQKFVVCDVVRWSSQAAGGATTKDGEIVLVVPPGAEGAQAVTRYIDQRVRAGTHRSAFGGGSGRDTESYVVEVRVGKSMRAKPVLYWPVARLLEKVELG